MVLLILVAFVTLVFCLGFCLGKCFVRAELYKVSGVIPSEGRRVVFYESEDYDDAVVVANFGWKGRGLDDITLEWGPSVLPIDSHGRRSVADPYWVEEKKEG